VVLPDIRTFCRDGSDVVDEVGDANAALRWVRRHAGKLGIDPHRIAAAGGSSGGHLALSTAVFPEVGAPAGTRGERPDLLLLFFPCINPAAEFELQYSAAAVSARGAEVNALTRVHPGLPPMLILQGTDDPLYQEVNVFCAKLKAAADSCDYAEYKGAKHGFFRPGDDHFEEAFARLDAYLVKAGYLKPA
jgi:acetyl esterase/lipase